MAGASGSLLGQSRVDSCYCQHGAEFFQRNTVTIIILIGALAAGIVGYGWWQRRRYRAMVHLLTQQIHDIDDDRVYQELTGRIEQSAQRSGAGERESLASSRLKATGNPCLDTGETVEYLSSSSLNSRNLSLMEVPAFFLQTVVIEKYESERTHPVSAVASAS